MNDRIGRAADGEQHAQRVRDGFFSNQFSRSDRRAGEFHGASATRLGGAQPVGMHGGNRRAARERHAERLGDRRHGRCGAHHGAGACGRGEIAFDFLDPLRVDLARAMQRQKRRQSVHAPRRSP